jgi:peptide/nickel transport system permease protein
MSEASIKAGEVAARRTTARNALRLLRTAPASAWFGMIVIAIYALLALFAPLIAPYGESQVVGQAYMERSWEHWLGTDQLGRDLLTRLIYGARNTIGIALITVILSFTIGSTLGILAALFRGWLDQILGRIVDVIMSIPQLIFALVLLSIVGPSATSIVVIIAVLDSTRFFRLGRAAAMNVAVMDFVEAARLRGENAPWIVFKEILPNIMSTLVAEFGLRFCFVFLTISSLSFLGLGIQPPTADWGSMVRENATLINYGKFTPLLPAGAIALLTVAINFVVDWFLHKSSGLRDEK